MSHSGRQEPQARTLAWWSAGIGLLALGARLVPMLAGHGLQSLQGYDDGVYYAGAAALLSGRVPYRDFVLLHPPGILPLLAPFAGVGRLVTDSTGFAAARVAFLLVGALNAVLVLRVASRLGLIAGVTGGLLYALWAPALYSERTTLLEPVAGTAVLLSLLLLRPGQPEPADRWQFGAGVALGVAVSLKIWYVVPFAVILAWQLLGAGRRAGGRLAAGAAAALAVIVAPFLALAPSQLVHMVVLDQLGRPTNAPRLPRLASMAGVSSSLPAATAQLAVLGVLFSAAALIALRRSGARIFVALLVAHTLMLLASPSYFGHYAVLVAAPLALTIGVAAQEFARWSGAAGGRRLGLAALCGAVLAGLVLLHLPQRGYGRPFPAERLRPALADSRCVAADEPAALALLDVLTRTLDNGCALPVDLTGITYGKDRHRRPDGSAVPRGNNPAWQRDLLAYLTSADTLILTRPSGTGIGPDVRAVINQMTVLARAGGYRVRLVHRPPGGGRAAPCPPSASWAKLVQCEAVHGFERSRRGTLQRGQVSTAPRRFGRVSTARRTDATPASAWRRQRCPDQQPRRRPAAG